IYTQIQATNSAALVLNPGIYVIKGGGLLVSGSATVKGSGILIYNAGSNYPNSGGSFGAITLSNSGSISLTPATSGTYVGILIFQARDNTQTLSLSGVSVAGISGDIYAPSALLSLANSAALKLPVIVNRLTLSGAATGSGPAVGAAAAIGNSASLLAAAPSSILVSGGVVSGAWVGASSPLTTHYSPLTPQIHDLGIKGSQEFEYPNIVHEVLVNRFLREIGDNPSLGMVKGAKPPASLRVLADADVFSPIGSAWTGEHFWQLVSDELQTVLTA
ncbi:MAG TPA: hypothetical protein VGX70_22660, partial [Gemmataceae bacterium]|nr:hypothetical protein [Gemmataceae bacterium]